MTIAWETRTVGTPEELLDVLAEIADDHNITVKWVEDDSYNDYMAERVVTTTIKRKQKLSEWLREFRGNLPHVSGVPVPEDAPAVEPHHSLNTRMARAEAQTQDHDRAIRDLIAVTAHLENRLTNHTHPEQGWNHQRTETGPATPAAPPQDDGPGEDEAPSDEELARLFWETYSGDKRSGPVSRWSVAGIRAVREALVAQAVQVPEIPDGWRMDELNWFEYDGEYGESNSQGYIVVLEGPIGERVEGEALELLDAFAAAIEQAKGGAE